MFHDGTDHVITDLEIDILLTENNSGRKDRRLLGASTRRREPCSGALFHRRPAFVKCDPDGIVTILEFGSGDPWAARAHSTPARSGRGKRVLAAAWQQRQAVYATSLCTDHRTIPLTAFLSFSRCTSPVSNSENTLDSILSLVFPA